MRIDGIVLLGESREMPHHREFIQLRKGEFLSREPRRQWIFGNIPFGQGGTASAGAGNFEKQRFVG
jgi:hypothetical protein